MVVIVFVVDTSASMNQRTSLGTTLLDVAKNAVESFVKLRQRDSSSRTDRYMLVTFQEPPGAIKAGWRENQVTFMTELRNLHATGLSTLGSSLKEAFDLLNLYRLQSGIDNYGMGRNPFYVEPALIICFTDGSSLSSQSGVQDELHLPMHTTLPGSELTKEPFRWDQRLYAVILRMTGTKGPESSSKAVTSPDPAIAAMCEVTGGKCYKVTSPKSMGQALESLTQKVQCGVVINFEKLGGVDSLPPPVLEGKCVKNLAESARDTDSPVPPSELSNHVGNDLDATSTPQELKLKNLVNAENHVQVKMEEFVASGTTPGIPNHKDSLQVPTTNGQLVEELTGPMGMSRSATASPVPPTMQSTAWMSCRKMIYIKTNPKMNAPVGHWPIPESFCPDQAMQTLPPREAHPTVVFDCTAAEPLVLDNLPFDKYELEPSPLTQYILERKSPSTCWQAFVHSSGRRSGELGQTFGYLKASTNLQTVNLFVMPYNYPVLFPLIDELVKTLKMKPTHKWKQQFEGYLATIPGYYAGPLRNALRRMGIPPTLVPEHMDGSLSFPVVNHLKKIKQQHGMIVCQRFDHQSKIDAERLVALVGKSPSMREAVLRPITSIGTPQLPTANRQDFHKLLHQQTSAAEARKPKEMEVNVISALPQDVKQRKRTQSYKNPFDISRTELLDQLSRMRINFFHTSATSTRLQDEDTRHTVAIADMGNFQEALKQKPPLREVDPGLSRAHMFGNPFKLAKDQHRGMVDEADVNEAIAGPPSRKKESRAASPRDRKRRRSDTPPPKSPGAPNHQAPGSPLPPGQNHKAGGAPNKVLLPENKGTNSLLPGHGTKRKHKEEAGEGAHKSGLKAAKASSKTHINPALKKLQQLHKDQANRKAPNLATTRNPSNSNLAGSSDISSILRKAITSQDRSASSKGNLVEGNPEDEKRIIPNSHAELGDAKSSSVTNPKRPSPEVLQRQFARVVWEENTRLRRLVFREIRQPTNANQAVMAHVRNLKGSAETQCSVLRDIIDEAELFKQRSLVEKLSEYMSTLQGGCTPRQTTPEKR